MLDALPIAAAIIGCEEDGTLIRALAQSAVPRSRSTARLAKASDWNSADCLQDGPIAELFDKFFADPLSADELDFRDGEGAAARYFRLKLAPLPKAGAMRRCLMSMVDRTVEVQSERTLRGEMLRDSLTGLPNRLGVHRISRDEG